NSDGNTQERPHWRVVRWEADRGVMVPDVVQPDGPWIIDQDTEHTPALWKVSDQLAHVLVDAFVHELDQFVTVAAHAERTVAGVDQSDSGVNNCPQCDIQFEARCDD